MLEPVPESFRAKRIAGIAVLVALCWVQQAPAAAGYCIADQFAVGCRSRKLLDELLAKVDDEKMFDKILQADIDAGACQRFRRGEPVDLVAEDTAEYRQVRRPADSDAFWMPASYAIPSSECGKPGQPAAMKTQAAQPPGRAQAARKHGDTREAGCVFKPVMSDADIAACRQERH